MPNYILNIFAAKLYLECKKKKMNIIALQVNEIEILGHINDICFELRVLKNFIIAYLFSCLKCMS